jgi:hypothetical protein
VFVGRWRAEWRLENQVKKSTQLRRGVFGDEHIGKMEGLSSLLSEFLLFTLISLNQISCLCLGHAFLNAKVFHPAAERGMQADEKEASSVRPTKSFNFSRVLQATQQMSDSFEG